MIHRSLHDLRGGWRRDAGPPSSRPLVLLAHTHWKDEVSLLNNLNAPIGRAKFGKLENREVLDIE